MQKLFILIIAGTDLIEEPGISAAGINHEMLKYTAALDSEFIYHGKVLSLDSLPLSPNKIVSPALISKACLNILGFDILIIDSGAHIKPQCPYITAYDKVTSNIREQDSLPQENIKEIFENIKKLQLEKYDELIIAECVVGGTTTALATLEAMGINAFDKISSSFPDGNHELKKQIVNQALTRTNYDSKNPLDLICKFGDAMQATVLAISENYSGSVILAGGTQMLAVKALNDKYLGHRANISIATSPWITNDKSADFDALQQAACPQTNIYSANISEILADKRLIDEIKKLSANKYCLDEIIAEYNKGHVKEGVGMGALLYFATKI
ncbi:MAG: TIGR00303 family protein [Candidatus Caenarcaniphilales bacterium]|jgi:uncharacterized protein (TIGR00303 family)|nr:TIGR00303 family protein [Candidatus Caenarcaniphilales bacterium]